MRKEALVLFAKAPLPGQVKTRLIGTLSAEDVTALYIGFLRDTFATMQEVQDERENIALVLCYTPADEIEAFEAADLDGCMLLSQSGEDLGARLQNCCADLFQLGFQSIVIIGADSPTLPAEVIIETFAALENSSDIMIGPASDGGFYLIGLNKLQPKLFDNIRWGTDSTRNDLLTQISELKSASQLLPMWDDIDTPEALEKLAVQVETKEVQLRFTAKIIKQLRKAAKPF